MKNSEPKISCFFIVVDPYKAFNQVLREVIRFALRWCLRRVSKNICKMVSL